MRRAGLLLAILWLAAMLAPVMPAAAAEPEPGAAEKKPAAEAKRFYVPPPPGKRLDGGLVGAGTRSVRVSRCAVRLTVLAPKDHVGLTAQAQPTLYYYLAAETPCSVQFVLNDRRQVPPLVEATLPGAARPGIHAIRLADHGITLEPDVEYDWFVQVSDDPSRRSPQNFSGAQVRRVAAPPGLEAGLAAPGAIRSRVLGASSLWYDAVDARLVEEEAEAPGGASAPRSEAILEEIGVGVP